jgi:hypothetical protein
MLALWEEMNLFAADEFRDGNPPANKDLLRLAKAGLCGPACERAGVLLSGRLGLLRRGVAGMATEPECCGFPKNAHRFPDSAYVCTTR